MTDPIYPDAAAEAEARGDAHLLDELAGPEPDYDLPPEPPLGAENAGWMLRRLSRARRRVAVVKHLAAHERDRIDDWEAGQLETRRREVVWLEEALAQYHRAVLAEDRGAKTIELPDGVLKARKQLPEWEFAEDDFLTWAQWSAPDLVRTTPPKLSVDKAAAKKALVVCEGDGSIDVITRLGEKVPGVAVTYRDVSFQAVTPEVPE